MLIVHHLKLTSLTLPPHLYRPCNYPPPLPLCSSFLQGTGPEVGKVDEALALATSFASVKL